MTKRYIVETITTFRHVHVVDAEDEEQAFAIASVADDNWQEFLGVTKFDINEYTEEQISVLKKKQYFWDGVAYSAENGTVGYLHPQGHRVESNDTKII